MNSLWTEETIRNELVAVLLGHLKDYAIQKQNDYRNGEFYQAEVEKIENEIKRRITTYEARVCFLSGEHLQDYQKRGYVTSCEAYREEFLTREQAETSMKDYVDYCEKMDWIVLESEVIEWRPE